MLAVLLTPAAQVGLDDFFFPFCSQIMDMVSSIVMELLSSES